MNTCFAPIDGRVLQVVWDDSDTLDDPKCVILPGSGSELRRLSGVLGDIAGIAEHLGKD